jgi:hypothetical protein
MQMTADMERRSRLIKRLIDAIYNLHRKCYKISLSGSVAVSAARDSISRWSPHTTGDPERRRSKAIFFSFSSVYTSENRFGDLFVLV